MVLSSHPTYRVNWSSIDLHLRYLNTSLPKTEHPLRAGIFLDYYTGPSERFTGQYIVADLDDFKHKHLHSKVGK